MVHTLLRKKCCNLFRAMDCTLRIMQRFWGSLQKELLSLFLLRPHGRVAHTDTAERGEFLLKQFVRQVRAGSAFVWLDTVSLKFAAYQAGPHDAVVQLKLNSQQANFARLQRNFAPADSGIFIYPEEAIRELSPNQTKGMMTQQPPGLASTGDKRPPASKRTILADWDGDDTEEDVLDAALAAGEDGCVGDIPRSQCKQHAHMQHAPSLPSGNGRAVLPTPAGLELAAGPPSLSSLFMAALKNELEELLAALASQILYFKNLERAEGIRGGRRRGEKKWHLCENVEALTWQDGKRWI
eukprot:s674_g7.t1